MHNLFWDFDKYDKYYKEVKKKIIQASRSQYPLDVSLNFVIDYSRNVIVN